MLATATHSLCVCESSLTATNPVEQKSDKQVLADSSVIVCGLSCWDPKGTHTWTEGAYNHFTADKLVGKRKRKREKEKKREREWEKEKEKEKEKKRKRMCLFLSSVWQPS